MATKKPPETVEALVLVDCIYGKCGQVVTLTAAEAAYALENKFIDVAPAAISNAKG